MKKPKFEFSEMRWACPQCNYSAAPEMERSERKHFDAHSLQCVRCLYRTETKATWADAEAAYRRTPAFPSQDRP
jgi:hypothetical protein